MPLPAIQSTFEQELVAAQARLKIRPNDADARLAVAKAHTRMGNESAAINELKNILKIKSNHWEALFRLGLIYLSSDQKNKAISQFKKAAKARPSDAAAYYQLGIIAYRGRKYKEAAGYLGKAVKINPVLADGHYFLAGSFEHLGDKEAAGQHYEEALKYIPDYAQAKEGLARVQP